MYNVSKEEYDTCRISQTNPRVMAVCDNPDRPPVTITFRSVKEQQEVEEETVK